MELDNVDTNTINMLEKFSKKIVESLQEENLIDINTLDNLYTDIRKLVDKKNEEINGYKDDQYHEEIFTLNINNNIFAKSIKSDEDDLFEISYK